MTTDQLPPTDNNVCYRHPAIATGLRCNKCERYICAKCAKRTPVGYTCPDCVRKQEDKYFTGNVSDYVIAVVIALPLSLIAAAVFAFLLGGLGLFAWFISVIVAPIAAGLITEAVRWGVQKRRSRYLSHTVSACLILANLPFIILFLFTGAFTAIIPCAILIFAGVGTIMARLR